MSYIRLNGEIAYRDRPGFDQPPAALRPGDSARPIVGSRAGQAGTVDWALGNQYVIRFPDKARLHYFRHEIERA